MMKVCCPKHSSNQKRISTECLITWWGHSTPANFKDSSFLTKLPTICRYGKSFWIFILLWWWKLPCQQANIWITIFDINQDTLNNAITRDPISLPTFLHKKKKNLYPLNNEVESTKLSTHYSYIYNTNQ